MEVPKSLPRENIPGKRQICLTNAPVGRRAELVYFPGRCHTEQFHIFHLTEATQDNIKRNFIWILSLPWFYMMTYISADSVVK